MNPTTRFQITRLLLAALLLLALGGDAFAQKVIATLLPDSTKTNGDTLPDGSLNVTDANATSVDGRALKSQASWLYFRADALPPLDRIDIQDAQLILVRNRQNQMSLDRPMVIKIASVAATAGGRDPASWTFSGSAADLVTFTSNKHDAVSWRPKNTLVREDNGRRYIGLLLLPSETSASRRIFYGLKADDLEAGMQPRLVVSYTWRSAPKFACTSLPSSLATLQTDGGASHVSGCLFVPAANAPAEYVTRTLVTSSLTQTPAVYGDLIFTVERAGGSAMLEAWKGLGLMAWSVSVDTGTEVPPGSLLTVNQYGLLRLLTGSAIYTFQLKPDQTQPDAVRKRKVSFGEVPASVVSGPDGTLYIASRGLFALHPESGPSDASSNPHKLWWIAADNSASARLTLSPDGNFVYFLGRIGDNSKFLAINAQTGSSVELGSSKFPSNVGTFHSPAVVKHKDGADFVFVSGNTGTQGVLWAVKNTGAVVPRIPDTGDVPPVYDGLPKIAAVWTHEFKCAQTPCIGQPALNSMPSTPTDLAGKSLLFAVSGNGNAKLRSLSSLGGDRQHDVDIAGRNIAPNGAPVLDASGNLLFSADDTLYRYSASSISLSQSLPTLGHPALLFGPGGILYAAQRQSVTALVPSYALGSVREIVSPSNLRVTGEAASGQPWTLRARSGIILDKGFTLKSGAQLTVSVNPAQ